MGGGFAMQWLNHELTPTACVLTHLQDVLFLSFKVREEKHFLAWRLLHLLLLPPFVTVCFYSCSPEAQRPLRVVLCSLSTGRQDTTLGDLLIISLPVENRWRSLHLYLTADWP